VKGVRKEFSEEDYTRFDGPAKNALAVHHHGHVVTVPPENYGVDLYSEVGDLTMYHEVEVSRGWKTGVHQFPRGSVPERKHRLKEMMPCVPLYFWMLRLDLARALVFNSKHLIDRWLVEVPNCKVDTGEYFYRIPKQLGKEFDLLCH
jgi:hypothetical protein